MATYKSKHTGERVDNAVTKIPESLPTEDSFIVVKADGSASEYIPRSQVSSDKLDKQTAQTTSDQIYGKLADGSQTMFDVTMGATATTIPRRDTAGRIQVADGVSGNDAVNFNQLSAVESSVSGLNIQNGSGVNSIQQKYTTNTREFALPGQERPTPNVPTDLDGTYSTGAIGEQSTELNGRGRSVGKRSFVANNRNLVLGDYASAFGNANIAKGNNAFVAGALNRVDKAAAAFGYNNYVNADSEFVTGSFNTVTGSNATVVSGQGNTASGNNATATGSETTASGNDAVAIGLNTTASGNEAVAIGLNTTASGRDSFAGGAGAEATSDCTFAYGVQTKATKTGAIALGYQAEANGVNSFVAGVQAKTSAESTYGVAIGYGAEANALHAVAIGHNAKANAQHAIAIGEGNVAVTQGQLVVGKWARPNNYLFAVGNGNDDSHRSLAFLVGQDGRAIVYGAPKDNTDVVRKLELDTKYDKTGGRIEGDVIVVGDLAVNGEQHILNTENLAVKNAMIYSNSEAAEPLIKKGGIGIKTNATDVYGVVYDPQSDSVKLGLGKADANGNFDFNANEGNPVAVRDDSSKFTNNNLVKWDSTNHKFVDSGKKIDDLSTATNLENGTGLYSLVQRYIKNDIDHSSIATGIGSVAFGGLRFDYDPTKHSGDTTNTAAGGQSFVAGCGNYAAGDWSFVTGKDNTVYSNRAFISGGANISQAIDDEGNFIKEKTNAGRFNAIFGNNNTFKSSNTLKESNLIAGGSNTVDTERSIVVGYNNNVTGSFDAIFGSTNVISADYSLTGGRNHVVSGGSHLVAGSGNEVSGQYNIASGQDNQNLGWNSAVIGRELIVGKNHTSQIILGQYNDNKSDTVLEIGWGNPDNRKNVFEVLQDGRAKVQTAPTENNDVLRYQDTAVEVETSLMGA